MTNKLDLHQLLVFDLKVLQQCRDELLMAKFLAGLDAPLITQVPAQILGSEMIPSLYVTFFKISRVTSVAGPSSQTTSEGSALIV